MPSNQLLAQDASEYIGSLVGAPVKITSGFRTPQHNAVVGGVANSAHLRGQAFDFVPQGISMQDAANKLAQSNVPYDQIYNEGDHVHISFGPRNRRQVIPPKMANQISDDDLLKALTSGSSAPAGGNSPAPSPQAGMSDEALLKALTAAPAANAAKPSAAPTPPAQGTQNKPGPVADAIRSVPGGIVKGLSAIAGIPGDVNNLLDAGANYLTGQNIHTRTMPTSEQISNAVAAPFGGFYQPQTKAGQYAETISQFAPAAAAPGSAALKAARVAAPGTLSEAAGQATEGTPYEGAARFVGALAGGGLTGAAKNMLAPKEAVPTAADLKSAAQAAYKQAEQAGVVIKADSVKNLGNEITQAVTDAGIDPTLHPKAMAAVKRITGSEGDLTLKGMDILRRVANGAAGSIDRDESRIAHIVVDHIDDFVKGLSPGDLAAGDAQSAGTALKNARALWAKSAKGSVVEGLFERAKNRAETIGGSGYENALRVEFRQLAQNPKRLRQFSQDEQEAIRDVARGGPIQNLARTVGKLAPTNALSILGSLGALSIEPVNGLLVPAAGIAGRSIAEAATIGKAKKASELVRRGGPAAPRPAVAPELLSSALSRKQRQEQSENMLMPNFAGAQ